MAVEAGKGGQGTALHLDDRDTQVRGVEDDLLQGRPTMGHDQEPTGGTPRDEGFLDRPPSGDQLLVGADRVRRRQGNGSWRASSSPSEVPSRRALAGAVWCPGATDTWAAAILTPMCRVGPWRMTIGRPCRAARPRALVRPRGGIVRPAIVGRPTPVLSTPVLTASVSDAVTRATGIRPSCVTMARLRRPVSGCRGTLPRRSGRRSATLPFVRPRLRSRRPWRRRANTLRWGPGWPRPAG